MDKVEQLRGIIANYWHVAPEAIDWETEFGRWLKNFSSLRMLRFIASVEEQLEINLEDLDGLKSFGDLRRLVGG
jgi:acyl carrier protein